MKSLVQTVILVLVVAAIAILPSYAIVRILHWIVASRNRPVLWFFLLLGTLCWFATAVWTAKVFLSFLSFSGEASSPPGGGGIDPFSAILLLSFVLFLVALWVVLLAPSFAALVTLLVVHPNIPQSAARIRAGTQRFWAHPHRNLILFTVFLIVAGLLRAALWWLAGF